MIWPSRRRKSKARKVPNAGLTSTPNTTTGASAAAIRSSVGMIIPHWTTATSATTSVFGTTGATGVTSPYYITHAPQPEVAIVKDMGLSIEPMVGLRSYYIDVEAMMLTSYNGIGWPHKEPLYAYCINDAFGDHEVPGETCQCGIYAWNKEFADTDIMVPGPIFGDVYLWGDVLVCERGFRAEIGYPKNLTMKVPKTRVSLRIRDGLQEAYGIPVTIVDPDADAEEEIDITGFGDDKPVLGS